MLDRISVKNCITPIFVTFLYSILCTFSPNTPEYKKEMPLLMKEIQNHMVLLVPATPQLNICDEGVMVRCCLYMYEGQ